MTEAFKQGFIDQMSKMAAIPGSWGDARAADWEYATQAAPVLASSAAAMAAPATSFLGTSVAAAPVAATAGLGAASLGGGFLAGRLIGKNTGWGGKSMDEHMEDFGENAYNYFHTGKYKRDLNRAGRAASAAAKSTGDFFKGVWNKGKKNIQDFREVL